MKSLSFLPRLSRVALGLALALPALAEASSSLPIRNRLQWLENGGYCGETSLQESALYYGIYVSQAYSRAIYDPTQQNDLVQPEEWAQVLAKLGLRGDFFRSEITPSPQYKTFSVWMKRHLEARRPVITTCYIFENRDRVDSPVDHIITATGWVGKNVNRYDEDDTFIFNEHVAAPTAISLQARWAFDTRSMQENGTTYGYSLQKEVNYGLALLGTTNRAPEARTVRIELDQITEPNLVAEKPESPEDFVATLRMEGLTKGRDYIVYRYNDPAKVPTSGYASRPNDGTIKFRAMGTTQTLTTKINSAGVAIFRCLPSGK